MPAVIWKLASRVAVGLAAASLAAASVAPNDAFAQAAAPNIIFQIERTDQSTYFGTTPGTSTFTTSTEEFYGTSGTVDLGIDLLGKRSTNFNSHQTVYTVRAYVKGPISGQVPYHWSREVGNGVVSNDLPCGHYGGSGAPDIRVFKPSSGQVWLRTGFSFQEPMSVQGQYYTDVIFTGPPDVLAWGIGSRWYPAPAGGGTDAAMSIDHYSEKTGVSGTVSTSMPNYPGVPYFRVTTYFENERLSGTVRRQDDKNWKTTPDGTAHVYAVTRYQVDLL